MPSCFPASFRPSAWNRHHFFDIILIATPSLPLFLTCLVSVFPFFELSGLVVAFAPSPAFWLKTFPNNFPIYIHIFNPKHWPAMYFR